MYINVFYVLKNVSFVSNELCYSEEFQVSARFKCESIQRKDFVVSHINARKKKRKTKNSDTSS